MKPINKHTTSKLYYKKWLRKVDFLFREKTKATCYYRAHEMLADITQNFGADKFAVRWSSCRTSSPVIKISVYYSDTSIYDHTYLKYQNNITAVYEPANQNVEELLAEEVNVIVKDQYPFKKYHFKVIFDRSKCPNRPDREQWFAILDDLAKNPALRLNPTAKHFNKSKILAPWEFYGYVTTEDELFVLRLKYGQHISRVEKYVLTSEVEEYRNREE